MRPDIELALRRALDRLSPLPVLQGTVLEVRRLAEDPDASTDEVVRAIERDEAFAANLLRFANSAAAARPIRARTVRQAVTLAGRRAIARLALEAATYRFLELAPGTGAASRGQMHVHAVTVAAVATSAAERVGAATDTVHLAALLHDIGKLVLPVAFGEQELEEIARRAPGGCQRAQLERDRLGVDHAHAGALLAGRSNMPEDIAEAIRFHHGGRSGQESPTKEAACVQLADAVAGLLSGSPSDDELLHVALTRVELPITALDELGELSLPMGSPARDGSLAGRVGELERLATIDDLTGLSNRRHWISQVQHRLVAAEAAGLLICDVDNFKQINDDHGHRVGDLILGEVARVLARHGLAGRLGGDEFAVWVPGGEHETLTAVDAILEDIDRDLASTRDTPGAAAVSIGAALSPRDGDEITTLLQAADSALYVAKAAGRRRAHLASG